MQETDDVLKGKLQAEVKNLRREMQAEEEGADKMREAKEAMTLSGELNDLWEMSERCLEEIEWTPPNIEQSDEVKANKTIVQAMFVRCQAIRENLQIILDTVREL